MIGLVYKSLKGYKYLLVNSVGVYIKMNHLVLETPYFSLHNGMMTIKSGYAWDGPSGPTIDTKTFMRGSLVHDVLYQAIREGHILESYRKDADEELRRICLDDGMSRLRAWYVFKSVRMFGGYANKLAKARANKVIRI
jgi:hypothetical protein